MYREQWHGFSSFCFCLNKRDRSGFQGSNRLWTFFVLFKVLDRSIVALKVKINWREEMSWNSLFLFLEKGKHWSKKSEMEWNEHKGGGKTKDSSGIVE